MPETARMLLLASVLATAGCPSSTDRCEAALPPALTLRSTTVDTLDVLLMIDNSGSMSEEHVNLVEELPRFVRVLATGDRNDDGARDLTPVRSLHVGIVTSDMGAGPHVGVPTCGQGLGDDGILRERSRFTSAPCMPSYPSAVFEFDRAEDEHETFAGTLGCVANTGTGGCGFEQQLESTLKAVTPVRAHEWSRPGYTPPRFLSADGVPDSVAGNLEGPNAGFLRGESGLAIVLLTDEEDCSVRDYGLFVTGDPRFMSVPLNLRCNTFGDPAMGIVHPVQRYVDGLVGLRRDPSHLLFAAVTGIPPETEPAPGRTPDFAAILANPHMAPRPNAMGTNLEPACSTVNGVAYPPIRIVQTAAGLSALGARVSLSSICNNDFGPAVDSILGELARILGGVGCLPEPLGTDPDGRVDCELLELLAPVGMPGAISDCALLPGRERVDTITESGREPRELCRIEQIPRTDAETGLGWYYDDFSAEVGDLCVSPQRIALSPSLVPTPGAELRLACGTVTDETDRVCDADNAEDSGSPCRLAMSCDLADDRCATGRSLPGEGGAPLACDPIARACAIPCLFDWSCESAGLLRHTCDLRTNEVAAGDAASSLPPELVDRPRGICVPSSCH